MRICPFCRQKYENAEIRFCTDDGRLLVDEANSAATTAAGGDAAPSQPQTAGVRTPTPEHIAAPPLSASLAMAFFANHFIGKPTMFHVSVNGAFTHSGSTKVLCQPTVKVNTIELAYHLMAIAFWYLRETNSLRFAPAARETGGFFTYTSLAIEINHRNQTKIPGIEFDLMEIIKRSAPGVTVETVVHHFLEKLASYPQEKVFQRLTQWMIQLGYGRPDTSPKPFFQISNAANIDFEFAPDCRRIMDREQEVQVIHSNWIKFQVKQPDIFRLLSDDVQRGFRSRTKRSRGSTFD